MVSLIRRRTWFTAAWAPRATGNPLSGRRPDGRTGRGRWLASTAPAARRFARRHRRQQSVAKLLVAAHAAVTSSTPKSTRPSHCAESWRAGSRAVTRPTISSLDGLARVSHVTDCDRLAGEYPFVVVNPDAEDEIVDIVRALIELKLTIIRAGGGTGYTGGAIPLSKRSAVIIREARGTVGREQTTCLAWPRQCQPYAAAPVWVTRRVMEVAESAGSCSRVTRHRPMLVHRRQHGDGCGGKKGRALGTALDNLVSWRMVTPRELARRGAPSIQTSQDSRPAERALSA